MELLLALCCALQAPPEPEGWTLVLSSGGVRGFAHIGVLEALEAERIPVERIVGSEMGALVGGLYALGLSAGEIEQQLLSREWFDALEDRALRRWLSFRAKQEDRDFLFDLPIGWSARGWLLPSGVRSGTRLRLELARLTMSGAGVQDFSRFPLPFRAVATDLADGSMHPLDSGSLSLALEASLATPVIQPPVPLAEHWLISGAVAAPVPVRAALELDPERMLIVDVARKTREWQRPDLLEVAEQTLELFVAARAEEELSALRGQDLVCVPELGGMQAWSPEQAHEARACGRAAVEPLLERLRPYALDPQGYAQWRERCRARLPTLPRLRSIQVEPGASLSPESIRARMESEPEQPLQTEVLGEDLARLYGLRQFERIDMRLEPTADAGYADLRLRLMDLPAAPWHLRLGMSGELTAGEDVNFVLGASLRFAPSDAWGSEWRGGAEVGNRFLFELERRQALEPGGKWFLVPHANFSRRPVRVELANSNSAQFTVEELELGVDCAYEPDENWRWSAGLLWTHSSSAVDIGDADLGSDSEQTGGLLLAAEYDSLDDTAFPRDGSTLSWTSFLPLADLGNADDELLQFSYDRVEAVAGGSLVLGAELDTVLESGASVQNFFPLGGFLRLSGLGSDAISGPTAALARAVYFRQLGATRAQREDFTWYAGASLEAGNVFADLSDLELGELRLASSAFLGLDTLIGPLYAGVGLTEGGSTSLFVVLGRVF